MSQPRHSGALTTVVPLFAPLWALSILTGVVLTFSTFFGATIGVAVFVVVVRILRELQKAETLTIKAVEVVLLGLVIPILAAASVLCSVYFPIGTTAINCVLISVAVPHLIVVTRASEKLNHLHLLSFALLTLLANPAAMFLSDDPTFAKILPFTVITLYAVTVLCRAIFLLREKLSIRALRIASLIMTLACATASVYFYFYAYPRFLGSLVETISCSIIFGFLDYLEFQMRTPFPKWTDDTEFHACMHVSIKICALLSILTWSCIAPLLKLGAGLWTTSSEGRRESVESGVVTLFGIAHYIIYACYFAVKWCHRDKKPPIPAFTPLNKRVAAVVSGTVITISSNIAIAFYYVLAPHPRYIPSVVLLSLIGILLIILMHFLDDLRAIFAPFNPWLAGISVGISLYALISMLYLDATAPQDNNLTNGSTTAGLNLTDNAAKNKTEPASMLTKEATINEEETFEIGYPLARVCLVAFHLFILLAIHFGLAIIEEKEAAKTRVPTAGSTMPPRLIARPIERDEESDCHAVDEAIMPLSSGARRHDYRVPEIPPFLGPVRGEYRAGRDEESVDHGLSDPARPFGMGNL